MKFFESVHEFEYPWDEVTTANWRKYCPWNKESQHVIAVDTLSRRLDLQTGILRTERLITCRQAAPRWITPILGGAETSHVYEISYVNPNHIGKSSSVSSSSTSSHRYADGLGVTALPATNLPVVKMVSENLTYNDLLRVRETVVYTPSPDDPTNKTRFEQHASVTAMCGGWAKIRERIEIFSIDRFRQNAERGRVGFEEVLETSRRVFTELKERERGQKQAISS